MKFYLYLCLLYIGVRSCSACFGARPDPYPYPPDGGPPPPPPPPPPPGREIPHPHDRSGICSAVTCDFEAGTLCNYVSEGTPGLPVLDPVQQQHAIGSKAWTTNPDSKTGNSVTGIHAPAADGGSKYALAYLLQGETAVMETTLAQTFDEDYLVFFNAWDATQQTTLRMCCDSGTSCSMSTDSAKWKDVRMWERVSGTCPRGTSKILFICQNTGLNQGACGVDSIQLFTSDNVDACSGAAPFGPGPVGPRPVGPGPAGAGQPWQPGTDAEAAALAQGYQGDAQPFRAAKLRAARH